MPNDAGWRPDRRQGVALVQEGTASRHGRMGGRSAPPHFSRRARACPAPVLAGCRPSDRAVAGRVGSVPEGAACRRARPAGPAEGRPAPHGIGREPPKTLRTRASPGDPCPCFRHPSGQARHGGSAGWWWPLSKRLPDLVQQRLPVEGFLHEPASCRQGGRLPARLRTATAHEDHLRLRERIGGPGTGPRPRSSGVRGGPSLAAAGRG